MSLCPFPAMLPMASKGTPPLLPSWRRAILSRLSLWPTFSTEREVQPPLRPRRRSRTRNDQRRKGRRGALLTLSRSDEALWTGHFLRKGLPSKGWSIIEMFTMILLNRNDVWNWEHKEDGRAIIEPESLQNQC